MRQAQERVAERMTWRNRRQQLAHIRTAHLERVALGEALEVETTPVPPVRNSTAFFHWTVAVSEILSLRY